METIRLPGQQIKVVIASGGSYDDAWTYPKAVSHDEGLLLAWIERAEHEQKRKIAARDELERRDSLWRESNPPPGYDHAEDLPRPSMERWHGIKVSKMDETTKAMYQADLDRIRFVREENARRHAAAQKPYLAWHETNRAARTEFKAALLKEFALDDWPEYGGLDTQWEIKLIEFLPEKT